jgi:hypothetical protein
VGREGQFDNIGFSKEIKVSAIPEWMFRHYPLGQLSERIMSILRLLWIIRRFNQKDYDGTVFLIYDILSFFFYRVSGNVLLINHNNVSQLSNCIKRWMTNHLPKNYIHIALNEQMEMRLKELFPDKGVYMVPHGVCPPSENVSKPPFILENESFLFCPVNRNYDDSFVKLIFESDRFTQYIIDNHIKLYVKESMPIEISCDNIVKISDRIDMMYYNYLIRNSIAVVLPYSPQFQYRSSGILFECAASNKPIISTDIEAMRFFEGKLEISLFNSINSLIECIDKYIVKTVVYNDLELFSPDLFWKKILML